MNKEKMRSIVLKNLVPIVVLILVLFGLERKTAEDVAPRIDDALREHVLDEQDKKLTTVTKVYDGDTFTLETGEKVRLIGIDAPEIGELYATSSKDFLTSLVLGKQVRLEKDTSEVDKYDRLLRYVYVDDEFINLRMIEAGLAQSLYIKPDVSKYQALLRAEEKAQQLGIGMWE